MKLSLVIILLSFATYVSAEDSKTTNKEDSKVVVHEETIGNVKVVIEGRNIDETSQLRTEWKKNLKNRRAERNKHSRSKEKDEDSPKVSVSIKWPADG
ncbi:MAG: hypothetical protein JSS61_05885 [Verrucomicrobia bacterium]|nr:hypothetical protein [Verrucomicrobiota bacterium]